MQRFTQTSSISSKLAMMVALFAVLLLFQFIGTVLASRGILSGLTELHRRQRLSDTIGRLHRITESLAAVPGKPGLQIQDQKQLFALVYPQAEGALAEAQRFGSGWTGVEPALDRIKRSLNDLSRSASDYLDGRGVRGKSQELLKIRQFALDATESEDALQLSLGQESNRLFDAVYRRRYRPMSVAMLLAFLFIAFVVVGGFIFIRRLAASITNLVAATRQVASGNLDLQAQILSRDEIGTLTSAFNSMIQELRESTVSKEHYASVADENSRLYHEAQEAIRARDEFLSIASHELKTPLTSLSLQLQSLTRQLRLGPAAPSPGMPMLKILSMSEAQAKKLAMLLDDLLDLTRIRLGQLKLARETTNLAQIAQDVVERFKSETTQKGIAVSLQTPGQMIGDWDPMRLEQVVSNLVSNAIKYGNGSPISIAIEKNQAGDKTRLIVSDRGTGIAPEMIDKVFERFERAGVTGKSISGLGLGLYICRQIVEAHGGSIWVRSELGKGSSLTVELPLKAGVSIRERGGSAA